MKTRSAIFCSLARVLLTCLVTFVFFSQNVLVVAAHQRASHTVIGAGITRADSPVICASNVIDAAKKSGSPIHQSDCCVFCQVSNSDDNPSAVLEFAKVIAVLAPTAKSQEPISWMEYRPIAPQSIGLKSSWSAQAPPQA